MRTLGLVVVAALLAGLAFGACRAAQQYVEVKPLSDVVRVQVGDVRTGEPTQLPLITWGGDMATILANGNAAVTKPGSMFGKRGLKFQLVRMDDFKKQVELFMSGQMPYLRGTMAMINMAAEVLSGDPRTRPVIVYQMTWSAGGDCLVVKQGIKTVRDLKGKTIALQAYGPHVDYLGKALKDAGLSMKDVRIRWTGDLTGTKSTPSEALHENDVDAAFVIIPDGLMLTSNGTVGTGAEGSVRGATILMSTKTASRIIADVYAVRSDYFNANRDKVRDFVHCLLMAEQELGKLFKNKEKRLNEFKQMISASAEILLDSPQATGDAESLYRDCEYVGFAGNVKFFGDPNWPRNFANLTSDIQSTLVSINILARPVALEQAKWEYDKLRAGLAGIDSVQAPKFKSEEVARVVEKKRAMGTLKEGELFSFEIYFKPNQNTFSADMYTDEFNKVVELASTYGGAVIIVEGHSDPMGYLHKKKGAAPEIVLKQIIQAAKNLSLTRSTRVRDSIMEYARSKGVNLDPTQFTVVGHGLGQPKTGICGGEPCPPKTQEQWLSNMRVVFRIIQVEAEESVFRPLE